MTVTVNTIWYANYGNGSSTGYYAVAQWASGTGYTVGQIVRQKTAPSAGNERCFICIIAGTSNSTEPTWSISTRGAKTVDNTVTWMECTGIPALNADSTNVPLSSANRSGAQLLGYLIQNNTNDHYFICTTAGTTGSSEPSYSASTGATTSDGSCTWTCIGAISSFTTKWAAPFARMFSAWNNGGSGNWAQNGDTLYVSSIAAEPNNAGSYMNWQGNSASKVANVICISNTGNIPPQSADVTTGASVSSSSQFLWRNMTMYMQGVSLGSTSGFAPQVQSSNGDYMYLQNCPMSFTTATKYNIGTGTSDRAKLVLNNCTLQINGSTSAQIVLGGGGNVVWLDTPSMLSKSGASWPTTLFTDGGQGTDYGTVYFENVDLSAFAGTQYFGLNLPAVKCVFNKCKFSTSTIVNVGAITAASDGYTGGVVDLIDCDSGGNTYRHERYAYEGYHQVSTSAVYQGGATNGTTAYSWHVLPSANACWPQPFECMPMAIWNSTTGSNRTVTLQGVYNGTSLPTSAQVWPEVCYFGTSSSTLGTRNSGASANFLASGSSWTANTSANWNSAATARVNSHTYAVGDLIYVSSAPSGALFICTTGGAASGSLPGGYATCNDGSSVTDGAAVFLAMMRFKMSVTMSSPQPQSAGYFNVYVKGALASSEFFIDPNPTLS